MSTCRAVQTSWRVLAVLAVAVVALAGCTLGDDGKGSGGGGGGDERPTQTRRFRVGDEDTSVRFPGKPAATVRSSVPKLEVELYDVHRSGRSVTVVFALHNTGAQRIGLHGIGDQLDAKDAHALLDPRYARDVSLVDGKNLKEYQTFLDANGGCLCTVVWDGKDAADLDPGERVFQMAQVAAPPADVDRVTVTIGRLAAFPDVTPGE